MAASDHLILLLLFILSFHHRLPLSSADSPPPFIWPLPRYFSSGNLSLSLHPALSFRLNGPASASTARPPPQRPGLRLNGPASASVLLRRAFQRCLDLVFATPSRLPPSDDYDLALVDVMVHSADETLQLGVDQSYTLFVSKSDGRSILGGVTIGANTVFGVLRGLETFSQLCMFSYERKLVEIQNAPWYISDGPRFAYRGLLLDTSRHYLPVNVIKQVIESMSYAKLNVLHWHIIDEESFPLEVPSFPDLWKGSYSKWERYTVEDAHDIVNFAKERGINVMAEIDVPGHAESWGVGYPDIWPSRSCREPLDVSKNYSYDVIAGILTDMRKIFPFELFHLGGDEVNTDCWNSTAHVNQWLLDRNMTTKDAYQYFVLRAQEIAVGLNWTPVNWEETFNSFKANLNPRTVVHNWLGPGVCPKAVAYGFRCIFSNQGVWYLDHLDVPWEDVYKADPAESITDPTEQNRILGGEVCMWAETADPSVVQQTIWPRAGAAAERMWSSKEGTATDNVTISVLPRLEYFRCLLTRRGVPAAPVRNKYARRPPEGPGSCYVQ